MTITNKTWVADHMGSPTSVVVEGTVVDVVDAPTEEAPRGAFLVIENEETGERAKAFVQVPMTDDELAAMEADRVAREAEEQARREQEAAAQEADEHARREAAEREVAASKAEAEQQRTAALADFETRIEKMVDERVAARLAEAGVTPA